MEKNSTRHPGDKGSRINKLLKMYAEQAQEDRNQYFNLKIRYQDGDKTVSVENLEKAAEGCSNMALIEAFVLTRDERFVKKIEEKAQAMEIKNKRFERNTLLESMIIAFAKIGNPERVVLATNKYFPGVMNEENESWRRETLAASFGVFLDKRDQKAAGIICNAIKEIDSHKI
jgi:hypothetical protein